MMKIFLAALMIISIHSAHAKTYESLLIEIGNKRDSFQTIYHQQSQSSLVIVEARKWLTETLVNQLFPYWYGTKWAFYGMTRTPGKGEIACGYFVTNVLTDAGFIIPRVQWAQSASEVFIKKLCPSTQIYRFSNSSLEEVEKKHIASGDGLYLTGLDNHTGFIHVKGQQIQFIHSNYYYPDKGVMSESIHTNNPFKNSKYKDIGKLFSDEMMKKWLEKTAYK